MGANVKNISAIHKKIVKNMLSEFDFISKFAPRLYDTGGWVENTKALERTRVKELGKMAP